MTDPSLNKPAQDTPRHAAWFSLDSISAMEEVAFGEYFSSPNGRALYKEYRNYMVSTYRSKPDAYLSLTTCRRNIFGDLAILIKIHSFLEQWGLINSRPSIEHAAKATVALTSAQSRPEAPFQKKAEVPYACSACSVSIEACNGGHPKAWRLMGGQFQRTLLCDSCYNSDGFFQEHPSIQRASFQPLELAESSYAVDDWTEQELDALLTAISKYGLDCAAVSQVIGRKPLDCMLKFLSLSPTTKTACSLPDFPVSGYPFQHHDNSAHIALNILCSNTSNTAAASLGSILHGSDTVDSLIFPIITANIKSVLENEEKQLHSLSFQLLDSLLARFSLKLRYLEELDKSLLNEKKMIEQQRLQIFMDRYNLKKKSPPPDHHLQSKESPTHT